MKLIGRTVYRRCLLLLGAIGRNNHERHRGIRSLSYYTAGDR